MRRPLTVLLALTLAWVATTGAFYEWGGPAARGVRELKEKRNREAASSLRDGRKDLPQSAAVRYDEALALARAGLADSARRVYRETVTSPELRGSSAQSSAAYNLGNEALGAGRLAEAVRHYRESLRIDPTRIDAKRNLEEAIRRGRRIAPPQSGGAAGRAGGAPPAPGSGQPQPSTGGSRQSQPPPQTGKNQESPQQEGPRVGGDVPSRSEAEHWLEALEAERKAARLRDRKDQQESPNAKDW